MPLELIQNAQTANIIGRSFWHVYLGVVLKALRTSLVRVPVVPINLFVLEAEVLGEEFVLRKFYAVLVGLVQLSVHLVKNSVKFLLESYR